MVHVPVLVEEVLYYLDPRPNDNFIDCTVGEGGHTIAILEKNAPNGKVLAIDADPEQIKNYKLTKRDSDNRVILVNDNFKNLKKIVENFCPDWQGKIRGILFDLGMSSWHLEKSKRGFSFRYNEDLDMCYGKTATVSAKEIINQWPSQEIERIIKEYGEERYAWRIADKIAKQRKQKPILTTFDLIEVIREAVPKNYERGRIHPATRTFQALRIVVNQELENLKVALPQALEILSPGGRIVVISFHSLEDRIVKNFFKEKAKEGKIKILTKKPVIPSQEEIEKNKKSHSAKLRAAVKLTF
ncbi:MAG TPA: 16S rRNA (cytosine(1402)-N(4))-methyltransferase RsmH [Candidatus Paceibacterota bacterium]|nr:16S rRNA (cytosine(1402)-N(4))-methyltransferase RsmH [Candidatus Pacearchaeota archaeon]HRR39217.1 16S rRNA (cytosine(1402)-N(4))-methyltransferase RsmH [Candidatus Paceibacterota bacterium]